MTESMEKGNLIQPLHFNLDTFKVDYFEMIVLLFQRFSKNPKIEKRPITIAKVLPFPKVSVEKVKVHFEGHEEKN